MLWHKHTSINYFFSLIDDRFLQRWPRFFWSNYWVDNSLEGVKIEEEFINSCNSWSICFHSTFINQDLTALVPGLRGKNSFWVWSLVWGEKILSGFGFSFKGKFCLGLFFSFRKTIIYFYVFFIFLFFIFYIILVSNYFTW